MEVYRGPAEFPPSRRPAAAAIGNFDGLHLGHRRLIRRLLAAAARRGLTPVALTFHPHPERVLGKARVPMIQTLEQRLEGLAGLGVDAAVVVAFDRGFASLTAREFITEVLAGRLGAETVVVGENFRFGRRRRGNARLLEAEAAAAGIRVDIVPPVRRGGRLVSSSAIRRLLRQGRVSEANGLLGRRYAIRGTVVPGTGRGRGLGFPTANIRTGNEILPPGVFLTLLGLGRARLPSLTNVGTSPTFGDFPVRIETHILDWGAPIYDETVELAFLDRLRPERAFASPERLAARLARDLAAARLYFGRRRLRA